jgi:hypothetical protein
MSSVGGGPRRRVAHVSELPDPEIVDRYPPGSRLREFAERGLVPIPLS